MHHLFSFSAWSFDISLSDNASHSITASATDVAGNTSTASTPLVIVTDNLAPFLSPNEIALVLNGGSVENITFRLSEELGLLEGATVAGFSTSTGSVASALYTGKGVTNLVTLTSALDGDWNSSTTVSYTSGNNLTDLAGNELAPIVNQAVEVSEVNLSAGDIAFTGYNSDGNDDFSFVVLKDIDVGTKIRFTDYGWDGQDNQLQNFTSSSESTITWEATSRIFAGTEIILDNLGTFSTYTLEGDDLNLSSNGDQILAYQGPSSNPTFITAIHNDNENINGGTSWSNDNNVNDDPNRSSLPAGLTNGVNAISFSDDEEDNVQYQGVTVGTVTSLRSSLHNNNGTNWRRRDGGAYTLTSGDNFTIPPDLVSISPTNGSTTLGGLGSLSLTFDDNITAGTTTGAGDIQLINVTDGNILAGSFDIGDTEVTIDGSATVTVDISGLGGLLDGRTYRVDVAEWIFVNADGNHNVAINGATQWSFDVDALAPTALSINRNPAVTVNANLGTSQSSVSYIVTFSEDITPGSLTAADFVTAGSASGGTETVNATITGTGDTYTVTVDNINQLGTLTINFVGDVDDLVGNTGTTGRNGDQSFIIINPEPIQQPTLFSAVAGADNFTLNTSWTAGGGVQLADGYLLYIIGPTGTFPSNPVDLISQANDTDFSDDRGVLNTATNSATITGLRSGTQYSFRVFPYTNSGNQIDYKTDATVLTGNGTTSVGQTSVVLFNGAAASISSLVNTQASSSSNFSFVIIEDGASSAIDNADTRINQIVIDVSTGNDIDWTDAIQGVQLSDGTNVFNTDVNGGDITVTDAQITFSNLPTSSGQIGEILDNATKVYSLNIWLRNPIANAALQNTIDGLNFSFQISDTGVSYDANSSRLTGTQTVVSGSTNNVVSVVATTLNWEVQPPATAGVLAPFTSAPVVEAVDANGNRDLNYTGTVSALTNAGGLLMNNSPAGLASPFSAGVYTFDITATGFNYGDAGDGTLTMTSTGLTSSPASSTVTVSYSDNSTITAGALVEPSTFSSLNTSAPVQVFDFTVNDDVTGVTVDDRVPTRIQDLVITAGTGNDVTDWSQVITVAQLRTDLGAFGIITVNGTVGTNTITFSSIPNLSVLDFGFVGDNNVRTFELRIQLSASISAAFADILDNQNFVFEITDANITTASASSILNSPESENSGSSNLAINVIAQRLDFVVEPSNTFINEIMAPTVQIEANDQFGLRDLDYAGNATISSTGSEIPPLTANLTSGLGTVSNIVHDATGTGLILSVADDLTLLMSGNSTTFDIIPGNNESDIIASSFSYEENIDYAMFQSVSTSNTDPKVFQFEIRDGASGGTPTDTDVLPTNVIGLSFNVTNASLLRTIGLFDNGDNLIAEVPASNLITFDLTSSPLVIPDDGSSIYHLRATFSNVVTDNEQFSFTVNVATANNQGSSFESTDGAPTAGVAAISSVAGDDNRIEVNDAKLVFDPIGSGSLNSNFTTRIAVRALDDNDNLDLDFNETITVYSNTSDDGALATINNPTGAFGDESSGIYLFPVNFQFTEASTNVIITLGTPTYDGSPEAPGMSDPFPIISSQESFITYISDGSDIPYISFPPTNGVGGLTDINSYTIAEFQLHDGNPARDGDLDGNGGDSDGAPTVINTLTISITNHENLDEVGIFDTGGVQYGADVTAAASVTFTSVNFTAPDNLTNNFLIKASFKDNIVDITDNAPIDIVITGVTINSGSEFEDNIAGGEPDGLGTFIPAETPAGNNRIEVVATEFVFVQQPSSIEGIGNISGPPALEAQDAVGNIDLDYNSSYSVSTPEAGLINNTGNFIAGSLVLTNLEYTSTGDGQLTIDDPSATIPSVMSIGVDVINTNPVLLTTANGIRNNFPALNAGSINIPIFGFSLEAEQNTPGQPVFNEVTIRFTNPVPAIDIKDVFTNFRLFTSLDGSLDASFNNTTELQLAVAGDNFVTFSGLTEVLDEDLANQFYYLVVDVQSGANDELPSIRPSLISADIGVTSGSIAPVSLQGLDYIFDDTRAPQIVNLVPSDDNIIVNINTQISITFDEAVRSLDNQIRLLSQDDATVNIELMSPVVSADSTTYTFTPPMALNTEQNYYINIEPGSTSTGAGFVDRSDNGFPGISNTTTWNFRTADSNPPVMSAITLSDIHDIGFNFSLSLDEPGTVYYVIVDHTDPSFDITDFDSFSDIVGASELAQGSFDVIFPNQAHVTPVTGLSNNQEFTVFAIAEDAGGNEMTIPVQSAPDITDGLSTNGVVVTGPTVNICVGKSQPLTQSILIREGNNNDFQTVNGPTVTYTIGTNSGDFVFDTNAVLTISIPGSSDLSNVSYQYLSASAIRITYNVNGTSERDFIRIDGVEMIVANAGGNGTLERIGGTAGHDGNSETDAQIHAAIGTTNSSVIANFTFDPEEISFSNQDTLNYDLIADPTLILGTNDFSGPGVIGNITDGYQFDPQGTNVGFNEITLLHTDQFGCTATSTRTVTVFDGSDPIPSLLDNYCENGGSIAIDGAGRTGFTLEELDIDVDGLVNPADISNPNVLVQTGADWDFDVDLADNTLNPDSIVAIRFTAKYRSNFNAQDSLIVQKLVFIGETPAISLSIQNNGPDPMDNSNFCVDGDAITLAGSRDIDRYPTGISTFSITGGNLAGLNDNGDGTAFLDPDDTGVSQNLRVFYEFEEGLTGCENTVFQDIIINPKPEATFRNPPGCVDIPYRFTGVGTIDNSIVTGAQITEFEWDFDDILNQTGANPNRETIEDPDHIFIEAGIYNVQFSVTSDVGCQSDVALEAVNIGNNPIVDFTFQGIGLTEETTFTPQVTNIDLATELKGLVWEFNGFPEDTVFFNTTLETFGFTFPTTDKQFVNLQGISDKNCVGTKQDSLFIVPVEPITTTNTYQADFELGQQNWISWGTNTSWLVNDSGGSTIVESADVDLNGKTNFWVTGTGEYNPSEFSFVYSPIFDISALNKPLLSLNTFRDIISEDGAIIEYSMSGFATDGSSNWQLLGDLDESNGIENWYNQRDISEFSGSNLNDNPSDIGWTLSDSLWRDSKQSLTAIKAQGDRFQLRVGFISSEFSAADGFAFDNVFIGEATRTVLIENFRNASQATDTKNNADILFSTYINGIDEDTDAIVMNYHTDFPGTDPVNDANPIDPSARALFYGFSSSPSISIDGTTSLTGPITSDWLTDQVGFRALELSSFDIEIDLSVDAGNLIVSPTITQLLPDVGNDLLLYAAILEKDVMVQETVASGETVFYYALQKMLPDAAGLAVSINDISNPVEFQLNPNGSIDTDDMAVVVFIQDEFTKEIYQAALRTDVPVPANITSVEARLTGIIGLYPNPASQKVTLRFNNQLKPETPVTIYDQFGKLVFEQSIELGTDQLVIDTRDFVPGLYHVQLQLSDGEVLRERLMIMH
ncbi:MAG: Ig-like domain-containing protein [Bacteroidota bacterium]